MKRIRNLISAILLVLPLGISAQTGVESLTPYGHGEDSIRCIRNTSLYSTYYDNKDYPMALRFWRQVYGECPGSSKNIYIKGELMYKDLFRSTGDSAYIDTIINILTQRTLYFGEAPLVNLRKALVLYELGGNDSVYAFQCYSLIKEVADSFPEMIDQNYSVLLVAAAVKGHTVSVVDSEEVVTAISIAYDFTDKALKINPADRKYLDAVNSIDALFRTSGVMTCKSLEQIFAPRLDQNIRDTVLIDKVFRMLREAGCVSSDFYYKTATRLYAINKCSANAVRLAELNIARKNTDKAVWYFSEAMKLDTSKVVQSDILTRVAAMELAAGKRQEARNHGEQAYELNNKNGNALFVIAEAYAGAKIGDAFDNHSAYWVAVDYLINAKKADPSLKAKADERIKAYVKLYPTREEGFFRGVLDEGVTYRVGGWINEITIIRFRKE